MVYGGVAWDPPYEEFGKLGINLEEEVAEIKKEIIIQPLADDQIGEGGKRIKKAAEDLGIGWHKIDRFFDDPEKFEHSPYLFGDKTGARWDARKWVMNAVENGAQLMNEVFCERVIIENGKAVGIICSNKKGEKTQIRSDIVILSAGGLGSPLVLKRSGIEKAGNSFFNDPYVFAIGYIDKELSGREVGRQGGILFEGEYSLADFTIPSQLYQKLILTQKKIGKMMQRTRSLTILVEIADDVSGTIDTEGRIVKPLSEKDYDKLEKGKKTARQILENAGAKDVWFTKMGGVHPGGTCKIGDIVDSDLMTCFENLFVVDASVMPEAHAIPPMLTILALAKRLSKHLS